MFGFCSHICMYICIYIYMCCRVPCRRPPPPWYGGEEGEGRLGCKMFLTSVPTCRPTCLPTYLQTYLDTDRRFYLHTCLTDIPAYLATCLLAFLHSCIHTYHTYHTIPYRTIPYHTIPYHTQGGETRTQHHNHRGGEVRIPSIKGALDLVEHLCPLTRSAALLFQLRKQVLSHGVAVEMN